jgi:hypothetical protein
MKKRRNKLAAILLPTVRLIQLPTNRDTEGEPRVAVQITPPATSIDRRPLLRVFGSMGAAVAAKRAMEGGR